MVIPQLNNDTIVKIAKSLGFDLVGFAEAELLKTETDNLNKWLNSGYHAGMKYMERNLEKRVDIKEILPSAKSIISLGMNYYTGYQHNNRSGYGKISRYAWGKDYHIIIWEKLNLFIEMMKKFAPQLEAVSYVDTGPVMDKAWAVKCGLGWLGKNSLVINKNNGSWFFIANIFTNIEIEHSTNVTDHCGSCTACIDACPTNAITEEYVVDSNKCISYLTIENKGEIPGEFKDKFAGFLFGCDICQDVCPWNKKFSRTTLITEFNPFNEETEIELSQIFEMDNKQFKERFKDSPIQRAKLKGLKRNASFLQRSELTEPK
ncbi:MAG TPA: tRNA epoxyqueuosine(34) reductase QueG [Ignavibacteriaceae bacterium]|nr:tRNA epoxyqueuosine(34) reductase QueG [Ignavibacteriaceae bacterium]